MMTVQEVTKTYVGFTAADDVRRAAWLVVPMTVAVQGASLGVK